MGTRGIFGFKCGDEYKLKWNQYDSYPDYLGDKMTDFVKRMNSVNGWNSLKKNCEKIELVSDEVHPPKEILQKYSQYRKPGEEYFGEKISTRQTPDRNWQILFNALSRGNLLEEVYAGKVKHLVDEPWDQYWDWEYAYVLNLDTNELEFYTGYENKKEVTEEEWIGKWNPEAFTGSCPIKYKDPSDFYLKEPPEGCYGWKGRFFPNCEVTEDCGEDWKCVENRCIKCTDRRCT